MNLDHAHGFLRLDGPEGCLVPRLMVATGLWRRGIGLMAKKGVPDSFGDGLLFPRCRELHTLMMRFPLDIVFLDEKGQPLDVRKNIPPWRVIRGPSDARHCFEVPAGMAPAPEGGEYTWRQISE